MSKQINIKKISILICVLCASLANSNIHAQILDSSRTTGIEIKTFQSKVLSEKRKIYIQTPSNMKPGDQYPVLYVLDGEAHTQLVTGQVNYLSEAYKIIPSMIVVTIENTDRFRDLTPTHSIIGPDGKPDTSARAIGRTSGGGEKFLSFIKEELIPYVESRYPTAPFRILSGHSLGGLMAVYCLVKHPDYFNAYIAISPSLQWDDNYMLKEMARTQVKLPSKRFLFFSDANEDAAFHQNQLKLDSILQQKNMASLQYKRLFYPEETHISEPVKAFYDGIRFVYPSWHLPYNSSAFRKSMSSSIIKDHFAKLSKTYDYKVIPLHDDMNAIGRFLRNDPARIKDAIELLEMNAANYPASPIVAETLGDTYLKNGEKEKAVTAFQKALSLNAGNEALKQKIVQLNSGK
jgi:predicted alpha/beta superfamily hydrolase